MEGGIKIAERGKKLPRTKPALSFEDEKREREGKKKRLVIYETSKYIQPDEGSRFAGKIFVSIPTRQDKLIYEHDLVSETGMASLKLFLFFFFSLK